VRVVNMHTRKYQAHACITIFMQKMQYIKIRQDKAEGETDRHAYQVGYAGEKHVSDCRDVTVVSKLGELSSKKRDLR
jgi:hypothetical protein